MTGIRPPLRGQGRAGALRLVEEGARVLAVSRGDNVEALAAPACSA